MAKQLRLNLNSSEAREFLIQKILSSYDNALFALLISIGQPWATPLPESSLPKSSTSTDSQQSRKFKFETDQNVVSKKRKLLTPWENEVRILTDNELMSNTNDGSSWRRYEQKDILDLDPNFKLSDNYIEQVNFPNHFDVELLLQGYSPHLSLRPPLNLTTSQNGAAHHH